MLFFFFDNYFTSLPLLEKLKVEGSLACGTIQPNRKGLPLLVDDTKSKRGAFDYHISNLGIVSLSEKTQKPSITFQIITDLR